MIRPNSSAPIEHAEGIRRVKFNGQVACGNGARDSHAVDLLIEVEVLLIRVGEGHRHDERLMIREHLHAKLRLERLKPRIAAEADGALGVGHSHVEVKAEKMA